jgi:hypothetical protein
MLDSLPDAVSPTVIIYPSLLKSEDIIYNRSDFYEYSSIYQIDLLKARKALKEGLVTGYKLFTDSPSRRKFSCVIECGENSGLIKLPRLKDAPLKLPFMNILKLNRKYESIISSLMGNDYLIASPEEINEIVSTLKEKQSYVFNHIQLFKDFIKQKPSALNIYSSLENEGEMVRSVCLKMDFNNKLTHLVFYRYIDGIMKRITGTIEEIEEYNG